MNDILFFIEAREEAIFNWCMLTFFTLLFCWNFAALLAPLWRALGQLTTIGVNSKPKVRIRQRQTIFSSTAEVFSLLGMCAFILAPIAPWIAISALSLWDPSGRLLGEIGHLMGEIDRDGELVALWIMAFTPLCVCMIMMLLCELFHFAWNTATGTVENGMEIVEERVDTAGVLPNTVAAIVLVILAACVLFL